MAEQRNSPPGEDGLWTSAQGACLRRTQGLNPFARHSSPPAGFPQYRPHWFQLRAEKLPPGLTRKCTGKCAAAGHLRAPSRHRRADDAIWFPLSAAKGQMTEKRCPAMGKTL